MATVKKAMKKPMMKKSAPKKMAKSMPKTPSTGISPMMKEGGKVKKYQNSGKPLSAKDSMNIYANQYDSSSAEAAKKLGSGKNASKDIKAANKARGNENRLAKKIYGTTPQNKMGGKISKMSKKK